MFQDKPTILVVDDEQSITDLLSDYLVEEGYNCVTASNGEDALMKLPMIHADLILLDLRLPGISGIDMLRQVASTCAAPSVIVLTAVADTQSIIEAIKSGAVDYIVKPFNLKEVNDSIKRALDNLINRKNERAHCIDNTKRKGDEPDWMVAMESIARGVEIRLHSETGHTMILIERTAAIALEIGVPEENIVRWIEVRQRKILGEIEYISSLLRKLESNPLSQVLLGMSYSYGYEPKEYYQN